MLPIRSRGLLLVGLAAVSWGTTGTTLQLIGGADPLLVGAIRMLLAAPALLVGAWLQERSLRLPGPGIVVPGLCMAAYQVCYFSAVPLAGVAATALLAICSAPLMIALLARFVIGEALTVRRMLALGVGVLGAVLLLAGGSGLSVGSGVWLGAALALGAGFAYSLYAVWSKRLLASAKPLPLSAMTFSLAAVALAPVAASRPLQTLALLTREAPGLLYLGLVATAAAYWLYTIGLRSVPATAAAVAGLLEPLTATVLGLALFHEQLGPTGLVGAALLLASVILLAV